ncbi:MAG: tRNA (adenosine(37)-N6)-dimethylallyltransferase MiaA [Christensenellales bacterium]
MADSVEKRPVIAGLVGPTASGKSDLAIRVAEALNGVIVCMDAMQVYRGMDIGTAKPSVHDQRRVPHRLFDRVPPEAPYSVAAYAADARAVIGEILEAGQLPLLCGGTGLYLRALRQPMGFGHTPGDEAIRARYQALVEAEGPEGLHSRLQAVDPASAARLHPNDLRRVIRALEVFELTGRPLSAQKPQAEGDSPWRFVLFGVRWERPALYERINRRVDQMMAAGLVDEVRGLLSSGLPPDAQSMQGLGYKELVPCLQGQADEEETVELIKRRTRNYAKRQETWFRREPGIHWFLGGGDVAAQAQEAIDMIKECL